MLPGIALQHADDGILVEISAVRCGSAQYVLFYVANLFAIWHQRVYGLSGREI